MNKVKVTQSYNDSELEKFIISGSILEVEDKRADELIKAKVCELYLANEETVEENNEPTLEETPEEDEETSVEKESLTTESEEEKEVELENATIDTKDIETAEIKTKAKKK